MTTHCPQTTLLLSSVTQVHQRSERKKKLEDFHRRQTTKRRKIEQSKRSTAASALLDLSLHGDCAASESAAQVVENRQVAAADQDILNGDDDLGDQDTDKDNKTLEEPDVQALQAECQNLPEENRVLRQKILDISLDRQALEGNDAKVKVLTGIPTFALFIAILENIAEHLRDKTILNPFQQLLLVCMRLKCNINMHILAYLFGVSRSTVSRMFNDVLTVMDRRLVSALVFWPERDQLK